MEANREKWRALVETLLKTLSFIDNAAQQTDAAGHHHQ